MLKKVHRHIFPYNFVRLNQVKLEMDDCEPDESVPDEISEEPPLPRHQEGHEDEPEGQRRHRARPQHVTQAGEGRRAMSFGRLV